jgi:uncharacterized protein YndB with AHSA1/START domain
MIDAWLLAALASLGIAVTQPPPTRVERTGETEITIRSRFGAPRDRVFAALTTPDLLRRWMSAAGREMVECQIDLRTGGRYRYVFRSSKGSTFGMYGTYLEVTPGTRIVHTEAYDGYDWKPLETTTELRDDGGGTLLVMTIRYPSKEICDRDFPNVESGVGEGFGRLEKLLAGAGEE